MKSSSRPSTALLLPLLLYALALATPAVIEAQPARISITILDPGGKPIEGVDLLATTESRGDVKVKATTNAKGRVTIMVPDVTQFYDVAIQREGYESLKTRVKPVFGETTFKEYTLAPAGAAPAPAADAAAPQPRFTPAQEAFNAGVEALGKDDVDTAKAKFIEARDLDPNLNAVYSALAAVYLEQNQPQEALTAAQRFLEGEPGNPRGLRLVYESQRQLGNQAEAAKALKELQSTKGADVAVLLFNEGAEALKVGDLDSAQSRFEEALAAKPDLHQATDALMIVYARKGDWANAAAQAEKAIAHDPANLRALKLRHEAYTKVGDAAKAKEALDALVKVDPAAVTGSLLDAGIAKFNANDVQGAIADLSRVVELEPNRAVAHYYLGLCYTNTSKPDLAKTHLQRFLELAPADPNAAGAREMLKYLK